TPNSDSGPDFLHALIVVDGNMVRGDVEFHAVASDWYAHGHHRDARYNNVILHVVTMNCPADAKTIRQDGKSVPIVDLDRYLEKPAECMEADTTPSVRVRECSCALAECDSQVIRKILEQAGDIRLYEKAARMYEQRMRFSWNQIFYQSVLEALGYSKNQVPFRKLAELLPIKTLWEYIWSDPLPLARLKCEAYLLGAAGLLPSQSTGNNDLSDSSVAEYVFQLESAWDRFPLRRKIDPLKPENWHFFRQRPQNFPTVRIAAAAVLILRFLADGFTGKFSQLLHSCATQVYSIPKELEQLFSVTVKGFWACHYRFFNCGHSLNQKSRQIVGRERARDIVINVLLPGIVAFAVEEQNGKTQSLMKKVYAIYPPLAENKITRSMRKKIGISFKNVNYKLVRYQQGLIYLSKMVCQPGNCRRCLDEEGLTVTAKYHERNKE
ncbi:DUF2851 family protein, partial [candidate division KSB1 bacterium]|nr:DUF2851 family protein [candidate division KSB1 bacterium]